jgi:hypothetical protein
MEQVNIIKFNENGFSLILVIKNITIFISGNTRK